MDGRPGRLDAEYRQLRWLRLYRPGPWRVALLFLAGLGCVLLATSASVIISSGRTLGERLVLVCLGLTVVATGLWLTSRGLASGTWVRDAGVRMHSVRRSTSLTWTEIRAVERRAGPVAVLGLPWRVAGEEVFLVVDDGRSLPTGLASTSLDFLARPEAYEIAATALTDWWSQHG